MSISGRYKNDIFIMRHKRKAETFFRKIEISTDIQVLSLIPILSFVVLHLNSNFIPQNGIFIALFINQ